MIPALQYLYLATLLFFPLVSAGYFAFSPNRDLLPSRLSSWPLASLVYVLLFLLSAGGLFYFSDRQGIEFHFEMGRMAREFEVSIVLSKSRLIWVSCFGLIAMFQILVFLDDYLASESNSFKIRRLVLFSLFSLFSILALLSGRALLAILFLETAMFVLHLLKMDYDESESTVDRVSFFKRCLFVVSGLVVMAGLSAGKVFSDDSIFIAGFILYLMSLIYNNHTFASWNKASWIFYPFLFALFIFWRFYQSGSDGGAPEFSLIVFIFAIISAVFAFLGLISPGRLACFYWYCISYASLKFFVLFSSTTIERGSWAQDGVLSVFGLLIMGALLRGLALPLTAAWRWAGVIILGLLHVHLVGLMPGVGWLQLHRLDSSGVAYLIANLVCIFFLSANIGRLLDLKIHQSSDSQALNMSLALYKTQIPLAIILLAAAQLWGQELSGVGSWDDLLSFAASKRVVLGSAAATVVIAALIGVFAQSYSVFSAFLAKREKRMQDNAPQIDPLMARANHAFVGVPEAAIERVELFFQRVCAAGSNSLQTFNEVYERRVWLESSSLVRSLSFLARFFHMGAAQAYVFWGLLILCFAAVMFYGLM